MPKRSRKGVLSSCLSENSWNGHSERAFRLDRRTLPRWREPDAEWRYGTYQTAGRTSWVEDQESNLLTGRRPNALFEKRRQAEDRKRWTRPALLLAPPAYLCIACATDRSPARQGTAPCLSRPGC